MIPQRLSVKFFVNDSAAVNLPDFVPVLQRWIQRQAVEGLLIDVADYAHVHQGPGVILIGHEADYSLDMADGRPGLLYTRKRDLPDTLPAVLQTTTRLALAAARQLEAESSLKNLSFNFSEAQIKFLDRLNVPNALETFTALEGELQTFAAGLYSDAEIQPLSDDPREPFTVTFKSPHPIDAEALSSRLHETVAS